MRNLFPDFAWRETPDRFLPIHEWIVRGFNPRLSLATLCALGYHQMLKRRGKGGGSKITLFGLRIDLRLGEDGDEDSNDVEWGGFGFCFVLAVLSFADARPRGASEIDYEEDDQITLVDFLEGLSFVRGELHFRGDYIRGRRLKTNITVKADGAVTLETVGRGKAALQCLDRVKGKKMMSLIS